MSIGLVLGALLVGASGDERAVLAFLSDAAGRGENVQVVTQEDVGALLRLEGEKQSVGCDDATEACVAEVAAALGAELLVRAELGSLDGERTLAVTVLNTADLGRTARALLRAPTISALGEQLRGALPGLIASARRSPDGVTRVFIAGVIQNDSAAVVADADDGLRWQWPVGVVIAGVGVVGLGAAGVVEGVIAADAAVLADKDGISQLEAARRTADRDALATVGRVAWIGGGVAVVVGAAVLSTLALGE